MISNDFESGDGIKWALGVYSDLDNNVTVGYDGNKDEHDQHLGMILITILLTKLNFTKESLIEHISEIQLDDMGEEESYEVH